VGGVGVTGCGYVWRVAYALTQHTHTIPPMLTRACTLHLHTHVYTHIHTHPHQDVLSLFQAVGTMEAHFYNADESCLYMKCVCRACVRDV